MKIPPSTIYITLLVLVGLAKQIPYHKFIYTIKHWVYKPPKLSFSLQELLLQTSSFYQMLTPHDKVIFEKRVLKFIYLKRFIPGKGLEYVTDQMKVLIASKATQVTFGYPYIYLTYLRNIYVYKSKTDRYYKGETSINGYIKLSWNNFLEGELNQEDGISLGLHEFTHALHLENHIKNDYYLFIKPRYLAQLKFAYKELKDEILEYHTPIRDYGTTNFHEFFAVCVEVFFEKPKELYQYNDNLYILLTKILNQDIIQYQSTPQKSLHF